MSAVRSSETGNLASIEGDYGLFGAAETRCWAYSIPVTEGQDV